LSQAQGLNPSSAAADAVLTWANENKENRKQLASNSFFIGLVTIALMRSAQCNCSSPRFDKPTRQLAGMQTVKPLQTRRSTFARGLHVNAHFFSLAMTNFRYVCQSALTTV
jgi:hypothetical protein